MIHAMGAIHAALRAKSKREKTQNGRPTKAGATRPKSPPAAAALERRMDSSIETLRSRHADLESAVSIEMACPAPDALRLLEFKRHKLRIRELIAIRERIQTPAA